MIHESPPPCAAMPGCVWARSPGSGRAQCAALGLAAWRPGSRAAWAESPAACLSSRARCLGPRFPLSASPTHITRRLHKHTYAYAYAPPTHPLPIVLCPLPPPLQIHSYMGNLALSSRNITMIEATVGQGEQWPVAGQLGNSPWQLMVRGVDLPNGASVAQMVASVRICRYSAVSEAGGNLCFNGLDDDCDGLVRSGAATCVDCVGVGVCSCARAGEGAERKFFGSSLVLVLGLGWAQVVYLSLTGSGGAMPTGPPTRPHPTRPPHKWLQPPAAPQQLGCLRKPKHT